MICFNVVFSRLNRSCPAICSRLTSPASCSAVTVLSTQLPNVTSSTSAQGVIEACWVGAAAQRPWQDIFSLATLLNLGCQHCILGNQGAPVRPSVRQGGLLPMFWFAQQDWTKCKKSCFSSAYVFVILILNAETILVFRARLPTWESTVTLNGAINQTVVCLAGLVCAFAPNNTTCWAWLDLHVYHIWQVGEIKWFN